MYETEDSPASSSDWVLPEEEREEEDYNPSQGRMQRLDGRAESFYYHIRDKRFEGDWGKYLAYINEQIDITPRRSFKVRFQKDKERIQAIMNRERMQAALELQTDMLLE